MNASTISKTKSITDQAAEFLKSGYLFASRVRTKAGIDSNSTVPVTFPLLGKQTTLIRGKDAVRFFYDASAIKRENAMPSFISGPLFGDGAVHGLDGTAHLHRKKDMADLAYDDARVEVFKGLVSEEIEKMLVKWQSEPGNVYDDAAIAYGHAAFRWAGIPMTDEEMTKRASQMSTLLDTFGQPAKNPLAWLMRKRLDDWFTEVITDIREGRMTPEPDSVAAHVAAFKDEKGELLDAKTAGIELQNLTRPTVAVSRFAAFAAAALVQNPVWIEHIRAVSSAQGNRLSDIPEAVAFAQETRRVYPFVPMLPGIAKKDTEFSGCPIHKGQRILIDILGTNTGGGDWDNAEAFDPQRFIGVGNAEDLEAFIPQGGSNVYSGHRCPGEKIAVTALSATITGLCRSNVAISRDHDDLTFPWTKILTRPKTGVRVSAKPVGAAA